MVRIPQNSPSSSVGTFSVFSCREKVEEEKRGRKRISRYFSFQRREQEGENFLPFSTFWFLPKLVRRLLQSAKVNNNSSGNIIFYSFVESLNKTKFTFSPFFFLSRKFYLPTWTSVWSRPNLSFRFSTN